MNIYEAISMISLGLSLALIPLIILVWKRINRVHRLLGVALKLKEPQALEKIGRIRKRYIVFSVVSEGKPLTRKAIEEGIRRAFKELYGETILVRADPQIVYYEPSVKRGVIRVAHLYKDQMIALLGSIKNIDDTKVLIIPVKTTGTIKKARKILYMMRRELQI